MKYEYLLRAGLQGSGNTFIQQILIELIRREKMFNTHRYIDKITTVDHRRAVFAEDGRTGIVIPLRDFRSSICSMLRRYRIQPTESSLSRQYHIFINFYNEFQKFRDEYENQNDILWLEYAQFFYDYEYLFDALESFLNIEIGLVQREFLKTRYSLITNKVISDILTRHDDVNYEASFESRIDEATQMSGNHVGTGVPDSWKTFIPKELHEFITQLMWSELVEYGFENDKEKKED